MLMGKLNIGDCKPSYAGASTQEWMVIGMAGRTDDEANVTAQGASKGARDKRLAQTVSDRLHAESSLAGFDINVKATETQVTLQGVVDTLAEKNRAGQIAREVSGVRGVENALTMSTDGAIKDEDVTFEVNEELNADPRVRLRNVGVEVSNGTARLVGHATSREELEAAKEAASSARGVKRVIDQAEVEEFQRVEPPHTAEEAARRGLDGTLDDEEKRRD